MLKIIKWIVLLPVVIFLVALALANRHMVSVKFDPFGGVDSLLPTYDVPLFAVLFTGLLIGTIVGGLGTWFSQGKHRRNARIANKDAKKWQAEAETLNRARNVQQSDAVPAASTALPYDASNDSMRAL